jgi:hypothetical protein
MQNLWITIAITLITWASTVIMFLRKTEIDKIRMEADIEKQISLLKNEVTTIQRDFHQHELGNERTFEIYHIEIKDDFNKVFKAVDALKDTLMTLLANGQFKK